MSLTDTPVLVTEADFGDGYEDISAYVQEFDWDRGRTRERERMKPGTANYKLKNNGGEFDRDNASSPFYPNVKPNRRIRSRAKVQTGIGAWRMGASPLGARDALGGGTMTVPLFAGKTEGGPQGYFDESLAAPFVRWAAVDDSKRMNRDRSTTGFGSGNQLSGARVEDVLDGMTPAWPEADRDIDPGRRTVQDESGTQGRFDYLLAVAESEGGAFFIGADGKAVFRDADHAPSPDPAPFGDIAPENRYKSASIIDDDKEVFNFITVTADSLADQTADDIDPDDGRADLSISTLLSNTVDMQELADVALSGYSRARRRFAQMVFGTHKTRWRVILQKELLDRITGRHRTPYSVTIEQLLAIQGISGKVVDNATWEVLWSLARPLPASPNTNLLTANQSSIETDATGWTVESGGTIARSTVESYVGSASLEITTTGAIAAVALVATTPVETASVVVGETYRASVYFVADQVFLAAVVISWRDSDGNEISQVQGNTAVIYPQDGWTQRTAEGVAPANATNPVVRLRVVEPYTNANIHYADAISLRHVDE